MISTCFAREMTLVYRLFLFVSFFGSAAGATQLQSEFLSYKIAMFVEDDRQVLVDTVLRSAGVEDDEERAFLVEMLLAEPSTVSEWARGKVDNITAPAHERVVAWHVLRRAGESGKYGSLQTLPYLNLNYSNWNTTVWYLNLDIVLDKELPVNRNQADRELLVAAIDGELTENQVEELRASLRSSIDGMMAGEMPKKASHVTSELVAYLAQTADVEFLRETWIKVSTIEESSWNWESPVPPQAFVKNIGSKSLLYFPDENREAFRLGMEIVEGWLKEPQNARNEAFAADFVVPFMYLHCRKQEIQELVRASLRPESPLYNQRHFIIPLLSYNPEYLNQDELSPDRIRQFEQMASEHEYLLHVIREAMKEYPK